MVSLLSFLGSLRSKGPLAQDFLTSLLCFPLVGYCVMVQLRSGELVVEGFLLLVICLMGFVYAIAYCCMRVLCTFKQTNT